MTLSRYSAAAWTGSRLATAKLGTAAMGVALLVSSMEKDVLQIRRRVGTDEQDLLTGIGQGDGRGTGDGRLADAPLPVRKRYFVWTT